MHATFHSTVAVLAVFISTFNVAFAEPGGRPNVILVMTDDQGYGDLSITGNEYIETPHMDRIATEGAWMRQFYVSPVCTPTRAHLMTGRYNYRTRAIDTYLGRATMEPDEVTIAEVLSNAGYATGIFGKWHLGDSYPTRSIDQGFQESIVHAGGGLRQPANPPNGERYDDPILYHNGKQQRYEGYCTDIYFDEAAKYIEKQAAAEKPFFVYLATNAPHGPFDEPGRRELFEEFQSKIPNDKRGQKAGFYAMIKNADNNLGRLMAKLDALGIDKDTLVVFLTDNGPSAGSAGPFRGKKGSVYQGGIRTVCFLRWPGIIEAGATSDLTTAHIDLTPTILDFCDVDPPGDVKLDGRSFRSLIPQKGRAANEAWPDRNLFFQWHRGNVPQRYHHFAAVGPQGRWKLLNDSSAGKHIMSGPPNFQLFDLKNDIAEKQNVADVHPDIVSRLTKAYDAWFDDVSSTRDPNFGMPPIVIGAPQQPTVILTPQDKRVGDDGQGWWAPGHWPVDVRNAGPYSVKVLLTGETNEASTVVIRSEVNGKQSEHQVSIPRGLDVGTIGEVMLPGTGEGAVRVELDSPSSAGVNVYQVTIK